MRPFRGVRGITLAGLLAAAGLAGLATVGQPRPGPDGMRQVNTALRDAPASPAGQAAQNTLRAAFLRGGGGIAPGAGGYLKRPGWTNASYRRAARKLRNQARNRRAHRG